MSSGMQPAWVLHKRPYGDSSLLLELLTLELGRVSSVLKGARRKARGGNSGGISQPFTPLLVTLAGRGELKSLRQVETAGPAIVLTGQQLFSGLYLNELITRLLPRFDPHPRLFSHYGQLLPRLTSGQSEPALRRFECFLLEELGYHLNLSEDAQGDAIISTNSYRFDPQTGLHPLRFSAENCEHSSLQNISGGSLLELHSWWVTDTPMTLSAMRLIKAMTRRALEVHLGGAPLRSRELVRSFLIGDASRKVD